MQIEVTLLSTVMFSNNSLQVAIERDNNDSQFLHIKCSIYSTSIDFLCRNNKNPIINAKYIEYNHFV